MIDVTRYRLTEDGMEGDWGDRDGWIKSEDYDALAARLAEAEKDAALDREIAQRNRDAVHELTERLAEAERERDEFYARAVSLFHLIPGEVAVKDLTDVLDEYKRWRASVSAPAAPERRACTCLYPTPAKYVPDFCGMCHGRITSTADAGHSVQCSECGATHVLRYTDRAKTAVSLAGFDGWSVDSSRVRCPKCSTASTVAASQEKP